MLTKWHNRGITDLIAVNKRVLWLRFQAQHLQNVHPKEPQAVSSSCEVESSLTQATFSCTSFCHAHERCHSQFPQKVLHFSFFFSHFLFFSFFFSHFFLFFFQLHSTFFSVFFSFLFLFINLKVFLLNCFYFLFLRVIYLIKFHTTHILSSSTTSLENTNGPPTKYNVSIPALIIGLE